jgi:hypothetical protein
MPTDEFGQTFDLAADQAKIKAILDANQKLNFVQRIINPDKYPTLPLPDEGPGAYGTHKMSYATGEKGAMVYPEIIQDSTGQLKRLGRQEAMDYAKKSGEFIQFNNPQDADWFGKNYKKVWEKQNTTSGGK